MSVDHLHHWRSTPRLEVVHHPALPPAVVRVARALLAIGLPALVTVRYMSSVFPVQWPDRHLLLTQVATMGAGAAGQLTPEPAWRRRLAIWALGGIGYDLAGAGEVHALLAIGLLALADWAINERPPLPFLPRAHQAAAGATVGFIVASHLLRDRPWTTHWLLPVGLTLVFTALSGRVVPVVDRVGRAVGAVVATIVSHTVFGLLGLAVIVLPWITHRLFVLDPVAERARPGWNGRDRNLRTRPGRQWALDASTPRTPPFRRLRWMLAMPVTVFVVVAAVWDVRPAGDRPDAVAADISAPAVAGLPWWSDYLDQVDWAINRPGGAMTSTGYPPLHDVRSPYVNVVDHRRLSWTPPACDCRRLTVWIYGGSTVWGLGQRDEHTIASELARVAHRNGLTLDVSNRGISGDLNWQASQRFLWDLAVEGPPDLVIFYDGANDAATASHANTLPEGYDPDWPLSPNDEYPFFELGSNGLVQMIFGRAPDGAFREPDERHPHLDPAQLADRVVQNYERGRQSVRTVAESTGLDVVWFWQPDKATRAVREDEPVGPSAGDVQRAEMREIRSRLASDVVDISDVFADVDRPVFFDAVHTNELGASIVAEAIFDHVEDQLIARRDGE